MLDRFRWFSRQKLGFYQGLKCSKPATREHGAGPGDRIPVQYI